MNIKQQHGAIAEALLVWLKQWGQGVSEDQVMDDLKENWGAALDLIKNLLTKIDINLIPDNLQAKEHNRAKYPDVNPVLLNELITPIHDLEQFGPTKGFRPWQTISTITSVYRAFERESH